MAVILELKPIAAVSPSLAELLRNCFLQAALSRVRETDEFVITHPKAWLGTAYHEVLEKLWLPREDHLSDAALVEVLWNDAIGLLKEKAIGHPFNHRFSSPQQWPGYQLARAYVSIRAQKALAERPRATGRGAPTKDSSPAREVALTAAGGKLVGKPDVVTDEEVRDYKSGRIFDETPNGQRVVKESYVRQLSLYGHLVHMSSGSCPKKGVLMPMQGSPTTVDLTPETCAAEAEAALELLASFNSALLAADEATDIAKPSPENCRWCKYKLVCPAFWQKVDGGWTSALGSAAVRGSLQQPPVSIHQGQAWSLTLTVSSGTTDANDVSIAPLAADVYPKAREWQADEVLRIVELYERRDGQLAPTAMTACTRDVECPSFTCSGVT